MAMDNNITKGAVTLSVGTMGVFNYALYENRIAPVRGIKLYNHTDHIVAGLSLKVSTDSGFFKEWRGSVQPLPAVKEAMELSSNPDLIVEGKRLAEVTDAFTINVTVSLLAGDQEIDSVTGQMNILAYDQWMGDEYPEHLAAFVIPNHPVVMGLVHDASMILKAWGEKAMLEGYQTKDPLRVRQLAAAIFEAIKRKKITYSNPPAKGGICPVGQRIRTPEIIMEQRLATCMDFSLLYASCLEAIGLNPVLYLTHNHIFTGVWLKDQTYFKHARNVDLGEVVKNITPGSQKIVFVECTLMRADSDAQFSDAEKKPTEEVFTKAEFDYLLDVSVARKRIKALPSRQIKGSPFQIDVEKFDTSSFPAAPAPISIHYDTEAQFEKGKGITDKFELWKSKLLDLTGNNMLLNLPNKGNALPIMSYRVDEMARVVLEGEEFHLLPIPDSMRDHVDDKDDRDKPIKVPWIVHALNRCPGPYGLTNWASDPEHDFSDLLCRECRSGRFFTFEVPERVDKAMTVLYRAAQASQQENGVSSLYMCLGMLCWKDETGKQLHFAPLVLVPVEMIRKTASQGYGLRTRDEEPHFNLTLLEMLRQRYDIDIGGLDPLPHDDNGDIDIRKVFAIMRGAMTHTDGWFVVETCAIGNFSFAQFAMWNDLRQSEELLNQNKLVRSLMKGFMDWNVTTQDETDDEKLYLPISVDDSQLQAIRMANHQQTFVLHGPPGTGKSQTITAMIANLAANGKRVLFVAEKMAALSVVEKRLTAIGLGDFCLELHSDKANKKHVLGQLSRALNRSSMWRTENYDETLIEVDRSRAELDTYAEHLHRVHACGYSVHDLIDRYEQVASSVKYIPFSGQAAAEMTREKLNRHPFLLDDLVAAGRTVGDVRNHPFKSIALDTYAPTTFRELRELLRIYASRGHALIEIGNELSERYDVNRPTTLAEFQAAMEDLSWWHGLAANIPMIQLCLDANTENVRRMIRLRNDYRKQEEKQQQTWKADFLTGDIQSWIDRIEAAKKKLFGSKGATKAIFTQLQFFAHAPITQDQMAALCREALAFQNMQADYHKEESVMPEAV